MSTPTLEIVEGRHWSKIGYPEIKGGRAIYQYRCHICNRVFKRHRNAPAHCIQCIAQHSRCKAQRTLDSDIIHTPITREHSITVPIQNETTEENEEVELFTPVPVSAREKAIIELICDCNIPYTQLQSPSWDNLIKSFDSSYNLPSSDEIRKLIIQYSQYICHHTLKDLKGSTVGLAVDGASFRERHYYALILVTNNKVRLLDIVHLPDQKAATIAKELLNCYNKCKKYNIKIAGVVSDNAAALKAAITGKHPLYLPALLGEAVMRVSCGAHTAQLVVGDVCKKKCVL